MFNVNSLVKVTDGNSGYAYGGKVGRVCGFVTNNREKAVVVFAGYNGQEDARLVDVHKLLEFVPRSEREKQDIVQAELDVHLTRKYDTSVPEKV